MRTLSLAALLLLQGVFAFAQYTPATVPNTKLVNNSYVSNPDHIIDAGTVARIDSTLLNLEKQTTAQVAVVVLKSIGDADIFVFAQELFNLWGIGNTNNNGLLILLVEDIHTVRFHTGFQLEGALPDVVCKQIQRNQMVPLFKQGDYSTGMLNGVTEVFKVLTDPNHSIEITAVDDATGTGDFWDLVAFTGIFLLPIFLIAWAVKKNKFADSKPPDPTDYPQMRLKKVTWMIEFGLIPALIIGYYGIVPTGNPEGNAIFTLYLYLMATVLHRIYRERKMIKGLMANSKYFEITEYLRKSQWYWLVIAIIFPIPFLVYFPIHFIRKKSFRNHARQCKLCNGDMRKLSETEDDKFLTREQLVEEQVRSVDYDVWQCKDCAGTESWHFINRLTQYLECGRCKARAYHIVSDRTLVSATYSSTGKGESTHQCESCGKTAKTKYTIAKRVRSSSSSSSGGSSWGSSSSSSGGSWGGGSSGGGGASSSW